MRKDKIDPETTRKIDDIVNKGANLHRLDKYGNDALWTAVLNARPSLPLIELLVRRGADPHRKNAAGRS